MGRSKVEAPVQAVYRVRSSGDGWIVEHDADESLVYVAKESAFEAAVAAASISMGNGLGITITVQGSPEGRWGGSERDAGATV